MRRLIERNRVARSVVRADRVQAALHGVHGVRAVDQPVAFMRRQLAGRSVGSYRLRNGMRVSVRHRTEDMVIFSRVFWCRIYDPPAPVAERLRAPLNVVDLGAHIGLFSAHLGRDVNVTAVEADDGNAELLESMIAANRLTWPVVRGYASNCAGTINFAGGKSRLSKADPDGDPISKVDVFPLLAGADLLKMDIEGGEWDILGDSRMAELGPPVVVMEWHSYRCPKADARQAACEHLANAGYTGFELRDPPGEAGLLWAWR
jgi:FkbM family methyltransferase